jgi:hypothetical protein
MPFTGSFTDLQVSLLGHARGPFANSTGREKAAVTEGIHALTVTQDRPNQISNPAAPPGPICTYIMFALLGAHSLIQPAALHGLNFVNAAVNPCTLFNAVYDQEYGSG